MQYVFNETGEKTAVLIPIKDWNSLIKKQKKLEQFVKLKIDLTEAFKELEEIKRGNQKGITFSEFLNDY